MAQSRHHEPSAGRPKAGLRAAISAIVFAVALTAALLYQQNSEPLIEVQADAAKYLTAAFNIHVHDAHSLDPPSLSQNPATRTDLSPGYPLFLSLFFSSPPDSRTLLPRVEFVQAVLAASSAVFITLLATMALPLWASLLAGLLVALNPHLIALSATMLTETLFVCLLSLGLLLFTQAWRRMQPVLIFFSLLVLGFAAEVRTIGFVVPVLLSLLCLLRPLAAPERTLRDRGRMLAACALGLAIVWGAHQAFFEVYGETEDGQRAAGEYQRVDSPLQYLVNSARPPNYLVEGISHSLADHADTNWRRRTDERFIDRPLVYAQWNLWERWRVMWAFRSAYTGTVEPYPMRNSAFGEDGGLGAVLVLMKAVHWPLALLSVAGFALVVVSRFGRSWIPARTVDGLVPASLAVVGFYFALAMIDWLPRYTIPIRPASYLLSVAVLVLLLRGPQGAAPVRAGDRDAE